MSVNESKVNYEAAKKAVSDCQSSIQTLQAKADQLQESLPNLSRAVEAAQKALSESHELAKAIDRALRKQEAEFVRLNNASEMAKRQVWEAISESYESKITDEVREYIAIITTIGSQIGRSRQYVLDCLFRNPTHEEHQKVYKELTTKFGISD